MTSVAELENHCYRALQFFEDGFVITCPISTKLLRANEKATSQNEGTVVLVPKLIFVTFQNTKIGRFLMESAIGVVYLEVSPLGAIDFNMNSVHRHSM